jgi:hypothetical protein
VRDGAEGVNTADRVKAADGTHDADCAQCHEPIHDRDLVVFRHGDLFHETCWHPPSVSWPSS